MQRRGTWNLRSTRGVRLAVAVAMFFGLFTTLEGTTSTFAASASSPPLVLGVISTDGGTANETTDNPTTVKDWAAYVNSHGGINGHPVKVYYENDNGSAATAVQDATNLIQNDHVIAIGDASETGTAFAKVAASAHVPVISLTGANASFDYLTDPNAFTDSAVVPTLIWAFAEAAHLAGQKNLGMLYCSEVAACAADATVGKFVGAPLGVKVPYSAGFSASSPNYTALCLAAKSAGATALVASSPVLAAGQRVYDDCAAQNYHPVVILTSSANVTKAVLSDPSIPVFWTYTETLPYFVHNAATKTVDKVMGSYLPRAQSDQIVFNVWTGLQLFAAAAANIPTSSTPTTTDIYNGLYSLHGSTLGGLSVPLTFQKGQANPVTCLFIIRAKNGQLAAPEGVKPVCESKSETLASASKF